MRLTVHLSDPANISFAGRAVQDSIEGGHAECGFLFHNGIGAFSKRTKTGWTVWLQDEPNINPESNPNG